jgi:hypothetical protein
MLKPILLKTIFVALEDITLLFIIFGIFCKRLAISGDRKQKVSNANDIKAY